MSMGSIKKYVTNGIDGIKLSEDEYYTILNSSKLNKKTVQFFLDKAIEAKKSLGEKGAKRLIEDFLNNKKTTRRNVEEYLRTTSEYYMKHFLELFSDPKVNQKNMRWLLIEADHAKGTGEILKRMKEGLPLRTLAVSISVAKKLGDKNVDNGMKAVKKLLNSSKAKRNEEVILRALGSILMGEKNAVMANKKFELFNKLLSSPKITKRNIESVMDKVSGMMSNIYQRHEISKNSSTNHLEELQKVLDVVNHKKVNSGNIMHVFQILSYSFNPKPDQLKRILDRKAVKPKHLQYINKASVGVGLGTIHQLYYGSERKIGPKELAAVGRTGLNHKNTQKYLEKMSRPTRLRRVGRRLFGK